jgi:protein-arginine kinase activator protein McsA
MIEFTISRYFNGTKLKLKIDTDTIKSLEKTLKRKIKEEKYDNCTFIRDKINILKKHNNGRSINF